MGKISGNKRAKSGGKTESSTEAWTATDHAIRKAKKQRKTDETKAEERARRSALLTRDSRQKREEGKLKLHIKLVQRQIDKLRERLRSWDDQEEKRLEQERLEKERKEKEEAEQGPKKRKGRKGPETWKLKGAARPAHLVYDFDVRYVDPHIKAHEEAKEKAQRVRNIFSLYKGKFGDETSGIPQPQCREFLALLMQLGNLSLQANQLKTARQAFLECMELESSNPPTTPARCQLMKLYLEANRPESARRLWERLDPNDPSVWIRYTAALIEFVSWKVLEENGSTEDTARALLAEAVKANVFCAYYLAFRESFESAMEHTDEIEDATEEEPLLEAIEYCNHEQGFGAWQGTEGALTWIQDLILATLNGESQGDLLTASDLEWREKLKTIKDEYEAGEGSDEADENESEDSEVADDDEDNDADSQDDDSIVDGAMYAGMFETAMEMLEDSMIGGS